MGTSAAPLCKADHHSANPQWIWRRNTPFNGVLELAVGFTDHRTMKPTCATALIACLLLVIPERLRADEAADLTFFADKIAPLLETHCLECHSHASGKMENALTLDSRTGWTDGGDNGPAIVPGKADDSLLIRAVRYDDAELQMPPDGRLPDADVELLVEWVERGAPDPRKATPSSMPSDDWWSLHPIIRPEIPHASPGNRHPIDAFIDAKLAERKITALQEADRRTLIRRLYFDLHGLPPTPSQVQEFVEDQDQQAFEKLVERLLDSPRYGERWARHWLDVIHFADSHGCEHDIKRPNAWRFRDYVIDRLNQDVPWGRFIREQLAADAFYSEQPELTAALGFIAAGPLEFSRALTAPVTFDYLDRDDMVTQTMAAFNSTTANCARCHTHKFDPITQEDYYALQAVFAGVGKGDVEYDTSHTVAQQRRRLESRLAAVEAKDPSVLKAKDVDSIVREWEAQHSESSVSWQPLEAIVFLSLEGAALTRQEDGSLFVSGKKPDTDTYTVTGSASGERLTAIRLDVLTDERLPMNGPGWQDNGNLHLTELVAHLFEPDASEPVQLKFQQASADWNQDGWTIDQALDQDRQTAWGIFPRVGESHQAVFVLASPIELKPGSRIAVSLRQLHGTGHLIGRFQIFTTDAPPESARVLPSSVATALSIPAENRGEDQRLELSAFVMAEHVQRQLSDLPSQATVYAVSKSWSHAKKLPSPGVPKVVHLLSRGDINKPVREAFPGALSAIKALSGRFELDDPAAESQRRAALADWIASSENPLTWRSIVNRVWQYHFAQGLCDTPNDFGRMGSQPSHPELLDWLAVWFRDEAGGSLKKLHRLILTSQTWKRASVVETGHSTEALESDAGNKLLWRMARTRLDAESFRDAALQMTGQLDLTSGGPGVEQFAKFKGPQLTPMLDYGDFDWSSAAAKRRSIYRVVWREIPDPFMESLDFPDLGLLVPRRSFSVSALQSLALYNNEFVLHASEWLAARLEREDENIERRIRGGVALVWLREPSAVEQQVFSKYVESHGLAALCRVLFNSNEFLFVD